MQIPLPVLPLFVTDLELAEVYLLLNMVSVKLLFLLLLFEKKRKLLWLFSVAQLQNEPVRDKNNNKATHLRYQTAGHRSESSRGSGCQKIKAYSSNVRHTHTKKVRYIPSDRNQPKNKHVTVNSSGLVCFLCMDSYANRKLFCNP